MAALLDDGNAMMIAANFVRGKSASGEEEEPASAFQLIVRWTQISKLFPTGSKKVTLPDPNARCSDGNISVFIFISPGT